VSVVDITVLETESGVAQWDLVWFLLKPKTLRI
jgi:hypothetical protein